MFECYAKIMSNSFLPSTLLSRRDERFRTDPGRRDHEGDWMIDKLKVQGRRELQGQNRCRSDRVLYWR